MEGEAIPVLDFREYLDPHRRSDFVRSLGAGIERYGFVAVAHPGIDSARLDQAYEVAARVFALPAEVKRRYETPHDGRQRGYTSFGVEHARDVLLPDLKEFWHVGRSLPEHHPLVRSGDLPPNVFPSEVPEAEDLFLELFGTLEHFANHVLDALGTHLGLTPSFFREIVHEGNSVLRVIHYPPLPADAPEGAVRAAAHEDINLITVLPVSTEAGLELETRDGQWMPVAPPPGVMVVDTGDMMARLTGGQLPATTHRVVNPPGERNRARYSMPFFHHPHPDVVLRPLRGEAPPITARAFLQERLLETGVRGR